MFFLFFMFFQISNNMFVEIKIIDADKHGVWYLRWIWKIKLNYSSGCATTDATYSRRFILYFILIISLLIYCTQLSIASLFFSSKLIYYYYNIFIWNIMLISKYAIIIAYIEININFHILFFLIFLYKIKFYYYFWFVIICIKMV